MTFMLWILLIALPSLVCALSDTQTLFQNPADNIVMAHGTKAAFRFKEGSGVFSPKDLVELSRPGPGVANVPGDLILVPVSKYSFEHKKYVRASSLLARFISHSPHVCSFPSSCPMLAHSIHFGAQDMRRCVGNTFFPDVSGR